MNVGDLFKRGFSVDHIEQERAVSILSELEKQTYVSSQDYRDPNLSAPMIADWDAINDREVIQVHNAPEPIRLVWELLGNSEQFRWFTDNFGKFSQGSVIVNKYRAGDAMGWHYDVPDSTLLQVLVYLGDADFTTEDGGELQVGKCVVNERGIPLKDSIIPLESVLPNLGTVVTILNTNPTLLHRVLPLKNPKNRFTLVCRYGYLENTFTVKKWRVMKGLEP